MQTLPVNTRNVPLRPSKRGHPAPAESSSPPVAEAIFKARGQELEFITTTGPPSEKSETSQYIVRSHAMHSFLLEKNGEGRARPKPDAKMEEINIDDLKGRFKLATRSRKNKKKRKEVNIPHERTNQEVVSSSRYDRWDPEKPDFTHSRIVRDTLDPYSLLLMPLRPLTKRFLYHYNTSFTMNSTALNPDGTWISFAITDMAVLHSTLAIVGWHLDQMRNISESSDTLQQKGDAIMLMNTRLRSPNQSERVNDGIVGAVAALAIFEVRRLSSFQHNPVLQRVLIWSDILYSSTWDVKPRFPLLQRVEDDDNPIASLSRFASTLDTTSVPLNPKWFPSNPTLLAVIETMRRICCALHSPGLDRPDRVAISYQIHVIEHHLVSLHDNNPSSPDSNVSMITMDLSPAFRLAALLYLRIAIRELPSPAKMHLRLVRRIRLILESESSSIVHSWASNQSSELLVWIAFMGGAAASDSDDRQYFVGLLVAVCELLGMQLKEQLQARLVGVCWKDGVCDVCFDAMWKEIELFRLSDVQITSYCRS